MQIHSRLNDDCSRTFRPTVDPYGAVRSPNSSNPTWTSRKKVEKWNWSVGKIHSVVTSSVQRSAAQPLTAAQRLCSGWAAWHGQFTGRRCQSTVSTRRRTTWTVRILEHCLQSTVTTSSHY